MKKVFLFLSLVSVLSVSAQKVSKKISLDKGQQIEQQTKTAVNMTQEMMGQSMEIKMESNATNLLDVTNNSASGFDITNTLKRVLMNMNVSGQETKFDSDKKEDMDGQLGAAFRNKINKPKGFTVNKDGVVASIKDTAKSEEEDMIGGMLNATEETAGAAFTAVANIPAAGAKVGDSWSDSTNVNNARTVNRYTLRQVSNGEGIVDINSDMNVSREMERQGMTMQMELKGTSVGEYVFDVNSGLVKSRKALTKATGSVDVMGQSIPLTIETTTTSTLTRK
ncbi:MAG TPA: DUF6263 family protein [Flavitalea sp.]|nr:DUF6263 family protein [Flavitalea sp.]